jgi:hypothetical protein
MEDSMLATIRRDALHLNPNDGLVLLYGHPAVLPLGLYAAAERLLAGETVLYLDGANVFDPFLISRLARAGGITPSTLLARLYLSRAFTCHQMERLVAERLAPALDAHRARTAILSGPLETFYDDAVPLDEALRLLRGMFPALRDLARGGYRLLALCPPPPAQAHGRHRLLMSFQAQADRLIRAEEADGALRLCEEPPSGSSPTWRIPTGSLEHGRARKAR